jgi:hypothetical protein
METYAMVFIDHYTQRHELDSDDEQQLSGKFVAGVLLQDPCIC